MVMDFDHLMSARADALFVSHLSACTVRQGLMSRRRRGASGLIPAPRLRGEAAAAYGGHPETAAPRMRWARAVVDNLFLRSRLASLGPAIQAAGVDSSASVEVS